MKLKDAHRIAATRQPHDYWAGWQDGRRFGWDERGPSWWRRLMWRFGR